MLPGRAAAGGVAAQPAHAHSAGEGASGPREAMTSMHMYPWMAGSFPGALKLTILS